jgi:glutathione S-transferase
VITIWGRASSSNVQKVLWACEELGLDFERHPAAGAFGGVDTPDYRAMNPTGLVPTVRDGDLTLWESDAVVRHLARAYGRGTLWPEDDESALAKADQWTCWAMFGLYPALRPIFFGTVRTPKAEQDLAALEPAFAPLARAMALLDAALEGREFLCADSFTHGEISPAISARRALNLPVGAPTAPNVSRWLEGLSKRPGYAKYVEVPMGTCREEWDEHERALG